MTMNEDDFKEINNDELNTASDSIEESIEAQTFEPETAQAESTVTVQPV